MNLLLVDDEAPSLRELEDAVAAVLPGEQLHSFTKARAAMEYAETAPVDIAFLDINMRFMDGVTMARKLIELYPSVNIVFCTADYSYAADAWKVYCSDYLFKPITPEKIQKAVEHLRYPPTSFQVEREKSE